MPKQLQKPKNARSPIAFLNIDNKDQPARIEIYDEIGQTWWDDGVTAKGFTTQLNALGAERDIDVYINTVGGDTMEGTVIYNALLNHQGHVNIIIDGYAISMGSVIAMAGNTVKIAKTGMLMIHKPLSGAWGNATDLRKQADTLDKVESSLTVAYTEKTGMTAEQIAPMLESETWLTASEALEQGFVDEIIESETQPVTNCLSRDNLDRFANMPKNVLETINSQKPQQPEPKQKPVIENKIQPEPNTSEVPSADTENARVMEIMNQCKNFGLEHMAMGLIENKTDIASAKMILSSVKAGIDDSAVINSQHRQEVTTKPDTAASWDAAFNKHKPKN